MVTKWFVPVFFFCLISKQPAQSNPTRFASDREAKMDWKAPAGDEEKQKVFFCNPFLLDGRTLNYSLFSIYSFGRLAMVEGNPNSSQAVKIPFRVYLKRDGAVVNQNKSGCGREVVEIEIEQVLAQARIGDELVIEPTRKEDSAARRILKIQSPYWFFSNILPDKMESKTDRKLEIDCGC